jgi:16S rRNA (uracil1498-N3)-methyltransferase
MQLPFFFEANLPVNDEFILSEESSKHVAQVLRMHASDELIITNGRGETLTAAILVADKKKTVVKITGRTSSAQDIAKVSIAVSLIKSIPRFEWFLEKATEIGVSEIIPLICQRTEKQQVKQDRMRNILVSAMLQSQQAWIPVLKEPARFADTVKKSEYRHKFIAHCMEGQKKYLTDESGAVPETRQDGQLILIGPEGDFTKDEIELALQYNFTPISLGTTRLRTETAALVAAVLLLNR